MNLLNSSFEDLDQIFTNNSGLKTIVTDNYTLSIISLVMSRTELLKYEVLNTELISELILKKQNPLISSLKCIMLLLPTNENLQLLQKELSDSHHYSQYFIYFTNCTTDDYICKLADYDHFSLVSSVNDIFLSHFPVNSRLFSLGIPSIIDIRKSIPSPIFDSLINRIYSAASSLQLSPYIRYDSSSQACFTIARSLASKFSEYALNSSCDDSLILILDRSSDPITSLITPFFYLSAVHELLGIHDNLVKVPGNDRPFVLDERHDSFLQTSGSLFLAQAGPEIANLMDNASRLSKTARQDVTDPSQIPEVVKAVSQFQEKIASATAHVAIMEAISKIVHERDLLNAGELEQAIVTVDDYSNQLNQIIDYYNNSLNRVREETHNPNAVLNNSMLEEILKLCMLYGLKYQDRAPEQIRRLTSCIAEAGNAINVAINAIGNGKRGTENVFAPTSTLTKILQFTNLSKLGEANTNVLAMYKPLLLSILERLKKGTLGPEYPYLNSKKPETLKPKRILVFYVGGVTYEEFRIAKEISRPDFDIVVGGNIIHNTTSYVKNEIEPFNQI